MSVAVLSLILVRIVRFGTLYQADEGTEAHLFQILMPSQVPIIVFFAMKWLPKHPRQALEVLIAQGGAAFTVFAVVFLYGG